MLNLVNGLPSVDKVDTRPSFGIVNNPVSFFTRLVGSHKSLRNKRFFLQKASSQLVLVGIVVVFLALGLFAASSLLKTGQDIRQQASGEVYIGLTQGAGCAASLAGQYGCDNSDNRLVCDGSQWRSIGQKCNPVIVDSSQPNVDSQAELQPELPLDEDAAEVAAGGASSTNCEVPWGSYAEGTFSCSSFRRYQKCENGHLGPESSCLEGSFCSNGSTCCIKNGTTECFTDESSEPDEEPTAVTTATSLCSYSFECVDGLQCLPSDLGRPPSGSSCILVTPPPVTASVAVAADYSSCNQSRINECNKLDNFEENIDWECVLKEGASRVTCQLVESELSTTNTQEETSNVSQTNAALINQIISNFSTFWNTILDTVTPDEEVVGPDGNSCYCRNDQGNNYLCENQAGCCEDFYYFRANHEDLCGEFVPDPARIQQPTSTSADAAENGDKMFTADFVPPLANYGGIQLHPDAIDNLSGFVADAEAQGYTILIYSGYRSYETQAAMYNSCQSRGGYPNCQVASPGNSEHQSGRAVDLYILGAYEAEPITPLDGLASSHGLVHSVPGDTPHFYIY